MGTSDTGIWYHVSRTWTGNSVKIQPQPVRIDDDLEWRDYIPCICVAPTVAQCVVALGEWWTLGTLRIYCTTGLPRPAEWVFDYDLTDEHRFYEEREFLFLGDLDTGLLGHGVEGELDDMTFLKSSLRYLSSIEKGGGFEHLPPLMSFYGSESVFYNDFHGGKGNTQRCG